MRTISKKTLYTLAILLCVLLFDVITGRGSLYIGESLQKDARVSSSAALSKNVARALPMTLEEKTIRQSSTSSKETFFPVTKVVDGDTLAIDMNGAIETIRLIGINTPETVDPRKKVECFGIEASNKAKELLTGKYVRIEMDPTQGERDKYKRLLAYVYLEGGLFFNEYMIKEGYAYEYTYNTPYRYQTEFKKAQATAKASLRGLWAQGVCGH